MASSSSAVLYSSVNPTTTQYTLFKHNFSQLFLHTHLPKTKSLSSLVQRRRRRTRVCAASAAVEAAPTTSRNNVRILIAGGGIGGLVFALAAKRKGFDVLVFEKDLSAIRGEGKYRGPIQIQSNALAALEAIDLNVAEEVMKVGCITGQRINGLVDGISGSW
ncbi:hypothetical protein GIB67_017612 [Kingdonia uniflora]|uniref:Zeaxanthin epoxidase n=1 Tax=Kingdonia uniflora TaxID=39325 RepID=A0A7J7LND2_9MAGN|nr:hypothetical protein GIB67_017612 [Kingdonia uniflora]